MLQAATGQHSDTATLQLGWEKKEVVENNEIVVVGGVAIQWKTADCDRPVCSQVADSLLKSAQPSLRDFRGGSTIVTEKKKKKKKKKEILVSNFGFQVARMVTEIFVGSLQVL